MNPAFVLRYGVSTQALISFTCTAHQPSGYRCPARALDARVPGGARRFPYVCATSELESMLRELRLYAPACGYGPGC
jgi:hypothetical protein